MDIAARQNQLIPMTLLLPAAATSAFFQRPSVLLGREYRVHDESPGEPRLLVVGSPALPSPLPPPPFFPPPGGFPRPKIATNRREKARPPER